MAIPCQTISVYAGIPVEKGKTIQLTSTSDPGSGQTITVYEWRVDSVIIPGTVGTNTVNTQSMSLGIHTITLNIINSCGSTSTKSKQIFIYQLTCSVLTAALSFG